MFWDILIDTFLDTLKMLPFLLVAYFVIELIERKGSDKLASILSGGGYFGFATGAILGLVPQCGFSGMAANFYSAGVITIGTLISVFISTSDEAIPLLLAMPDNWKSLVTLLVLKLVFAILFGFITDFVIKRFIPATYRGGYKGDIHDIDCHDHHEEEGLFIATLRHTGIIAIYIFVTLLLVNLITSWIGDERLTSIIDNAGSLQIFVAGLIGMIPNCGSSVLLTQMYANGHLSFAAMFAGLCSGSGIGTLVLIQTEKNKRRAASILALIYIYGIVAGLMVSLLPL